VIVIDEHLQGLRLEEAISRWYPGSVVSVVELRPGTVIKDDAIPRLLLGVEEPVFVTLNSPHFWRRSEAHDGYCIVCFTLPADDAEQVPVLLRRLFRLDEFKTRALRLGKVARVSGGQVAFYQSDEPQIRVLPLP
jgi:hypothetical protein